jgi:hypothetical protein
MFSLAIDRLRWYSERLRLLKARRQEQANVVPDGPEHKPVDLDSSCQAQVPDAFRHETLDSDSSSQAQASGLFQHEPLDLNSPSIRLIQIHPADDPDGRIRCTLRLTSTDTEYTCLSYVWGDEHTGDWIYLNNMRFLVRQNLLDFLQSARRMPELTSQWLWVDALCIDQANTLERQHQVQQMGQVYSGAKEVISWLGIKKDIVTFFRDRPNDEPNADGLRALNISPYWRRAWIVQEIILGPHVKLMADVYTLPLDGLPLSHTAITIRSLRYGILYTRILQIRELLQAREQSGVTLIYLLHYFQHQSCHITHDRIFSLLGLCKSGSDIKVDYKISDLGLTVKVLKHCHESFCLCAIQTISMALKLHWTLSLNEYTNSYTYLALPIPRGNGKDLQPRDKRGHRRNSDCVRHRGKDCVNKDTHRIELCESQSQSSADSSYYEPKIIITLNLHHLCSMYCEELVIEASSKRVIVEYRYSARNIEHKSRKGHRRSILLQLLDHGRTCLVFIPLEIWLWVASVCSMSRPLIKFDKPQDTCCSRVLSPGSQRLGNSQGPSLQFLGNGKPVGKYSRLPRDIDKFIDFYQEKRFEW